jgi:hypothetical protein
MALTRHAPCLAHKKDARNAYRQFLSEGIAMGKRPELVGGGLHHSQMLESNSAAMGDYDERVLGGGDFVASLCDEARLCDKLPRTMDLSSLHVSVSDCFKLPAAAVLRRGRRNQFSEARELFCYVAVRELGYSGTKVGALLGTGTPAVSRSVRRGEELITVRPELKDWFKMKLKQ